MKNIQEEILKRYLEMELDAENIGKLLKLIKVRKLAVLQYMQTNEKFVDSRNKFMTSIRKCNALIKVLTQTDVEI